MRKREKYGKICSNIIFKIKMNTKNSLDIPVFQDELDFKALENILECIDHVTPKKVSRNEFNDMKWNFLVETGKDKFEKQYDLFLPEDLVHGEILHLIDFLSRRFWLENYTPYWRIITKTKVMIGVILRGMWEEDGEKYLQELAQKYSLSPEFIARYNSQKHWWEKMNFSDAKEMIESVKFRREIDNKEKIWKNDDDIVLWFEELKELYGEEFDLTFFRKWVNMLRLGMMTITQAEQRAKIQWCEENWFEKQSYSPRVITYIKWMQIITINVLNQDLDEKERLLRNKIWLDTYKKSLSIARKSWNKASIEKLELEAVKAILWCIWEYGYYNNQNQYWFQLNKIAKYKEIFCSWFSSLAHSFLTELWIHHNGLNIENHSALELIIWNKRYYFDPSNLNELYEFEYWEINWRLREIKLVWHNFPIQYWYSYDAEKSLLSHILINKSQIVEDGWLVNKLLIKAIELNPEYPWTYLNLWNVYSNLWQNNDAITYYNISLEKFFSWKTVINIGNQYYLSWNMIKSLSYYEKALPHIPFAYLWNIYENISELYGINWDNKKSILYKFAFELISWKKPIIDWEYLEDKESIKDLISFKVWIHSYLWDN